MPRFSLIHWQDPGAEKYLSENRLRYQVQSQLTRNGRVARLPSLRQAVRFLKRKEVTPK